MKFAPLDFTSLIRPNFIHPLPVSWQTERDLYFNVTPNTLETHSKDTLRCIHSVDSLQHTADCFPNLNVSESDVVLKQPSIMRV